MYEETFYALYEDGSAGTLTVSAPDRESITEPALAKPGHLVSGEEYDKAAAALASLRHAYVQRLLQDETQRQESDYRALRDAGIPESTARRLSGLREGD